MEFRGFKARWYFEYYNTISKEWLASKKFYDGTWEDAVTMLSKLARHRVGRYSKQNTRDRFRVSPVAVLED